MDLLAIFISAAIVNNFVLSYCLGICLLLGLNRPDKAFGLGIATTFVMVLAAAATWVINNWILVPAGALFLQYAAFILAIVILVQLVEILAGPVLRQRLGVYLPLFTANCAVLGLTLLASLNEYTFIESIIFALGAGAGFTLVLVIIAGIREEIEFAPIPEPFKGVPITLVIAGILALAFMGFAGLIKG